MPLTNFRKDIDRIDEAIVRLLDERARVAKEIGHAKRTLELPLHNPGREQDVLRRLHALSDGSMPLANLDAIYRVVMAECLALQRADVASCRGQHNIGAGKIDAPAEIVENHEVAEGFFRMRLRNSALAGIFRPGQFFQLRPDAGQGECFLRRPFAPSAATDDGFTFIYAVVGSGTRALTRLAPGARVSVLAPLGNSYRLAPPGAHALLIGGGVGAPSLAPLAKALGDSGVKTTILLGARTSAMLLERETFATLTDRLIIATDDGSDGDHRGTVIDAFRRERDSMDPIAMLYGCGPLPMLRAVAALAEELGAECQVSLEERMACGFGACMGCVVPTTNGKDGPVFRRVCHDGPVFNSRDLAWNEIR